MIKNIFIALIFIPLGAVAQPLGDSTLILSSRTLNYFLTAAECLSIKAPEAEKKDFLTARIMSLQWDANSDQIINKQWLSEYISAEDKDRSEIYQAINKYCPRTARSIAASVSADGFSFSPLPAAALADVVIKIISINTLDKNDLRTIFEDENEALGLTDVY